MMQRDVVPNGHSRPVAGCASVSLACPLHRNAVCGTSGIGLLRKIRTAARAGRLVLMISAGIMLLPHASPAASLPNAAQNVDYQVVEQDIGGVVTGIAAEIGVRADISAKLHGQVHGRLPAAPAAQMLDRLASLYGFDWYCDGHTLYASAYAEAQHKVIQLGAVPRDDVQQALDDWGVADPRWPVRFSTAGDMLLVSGPPRLVAMVEETVAALESRAHVGVAEVHVFRGASGAGS